MRMDSRKDHLSRILKLGLIALVVYFSQIYPYAHFHHIHADAYSSEEVATHSTHGEPYHSHHGHDHDYSSHQSGDSHHHHELIQHVDWFLVRTQTTNPLSQVEFSYVSVQANLSPIPVPSQIGKRIESEMLHELVSIDGIDPRGPPILG